MSRGRVDGPSGIAQGKVSQMPSLSKKSLSLFLRNNCERQFILSLYGDDERVRHELPPRDQNRFALGLAGEEGYNWQAEKVSELQEVFGEDNVHINPPKTGNRPGTKPLCEELLGKLRPYQFIVEAEYKSDAPTFRAAIGLTHLKDFLATTSKSVRRTPT